MKFLLRAKTALTSPATRRFLWRARKYMMLAVSVIEVFLRENTEAIMSLA